MKRSVLLVLLVTLCSLGLRAQSSMTDSQVMQFVLKEHEAGTSQTQIVTKLMQRGVDIQQIRRVIPTRAYPLKKAVCEKTTAKTKAKRKTT